MVSGDEKDWGNLENSEEFKYNPEESFLKELNGEDDEDEEEVEIIDEAYLKKDLKQRFFTDYIETILENAKTSAYFFNLFLKINKMPEIEDDFLTILDGAEHLILQNNMSLKFKPRDHYNAHIFDKIDTFNKFIKKNLSLKMPDIFKYLTGTYYHESLYTDYTGLEDTLFIFPNKIIVAYNNAFSLKALTAEEGNRILPQVNYSPDGSLKKSNLEVDEQNRLRLSSQSCFDVVKGKEKEFEKVYRGIVLLCDRVNKLIDLNASEGIKHVFSYVLREAQPKLFE